MHAPDVQRRSVVLSCALAIIVAGSFSAITAAEGRLLQKTVEFTGEITFLEHKVPALVIGAVRNGERAIAGFGTTSTGSSAVPDGKTIFRIGSVTKAFTGAVLASTAVEGTIALTDRLEQHANGVTGASPLIRVLILTFLIAENGYVSKAGVAFARKAWRDCHTYRVTVAFTVVGALAAFAVFVMRGRLVT